MLRRSVSFSTHKTKPRRTVSRSPLQLAAAEQARELGPRLEVIDVRIGNQTMSYNTQQGDWQSGNYMLKDFTHILFLFLHLDGLAHSSSVSSRELAKLEKTKQDLEQDNATLRAKIEILLEMLAEATAEQEIR